ncbi:hypothetical protein ACYZTL_25875 [Pseudomonas sp. LB3P81]
MTLWKNIDPERYRDQKNELKRALPLLAVTRIKDNFPLPHPLNSLKTKTNNIDYHLAATMFVTFSTKQY